MSRAAIELMILRRMRAGPTHQCALGRAQPMLQLLIERGLVRRVAPPGVRSKIMVELTDAGRHRLAGTGP